MEALRMRYGPWTITGESQQSILADLEVRHLPVEFSGVYGSAEVVGIQV